MFAATLHEVVLTDVGQRTRWNGKRKYSSMAVTCRMTEPCRLGDRRRQILGSRGPSTMRERGARDHFSVGMRNEAGETRRFEWRAKRTKFSRMTFSSPGIFRAEKYRKEKVSEGEKIKCIV